MKKILSVAISVICLSIISLTFGLPSQAEAATKTPVTLESSQTDKATVFKGIVKKLDGGTALFTNKIIYPLTGGDFQTIVGKEVYIIGKIVKEENVDKIMVSRVQFEKK